MVNHVSVRSLISTLALLACAALPAAAQQVGTVVGGDATINQPDATTTIINQTTDRAIINWNQFNIDAGSLVRFLQPSASSVILNRVTGTDPSSILGSLQANGNVYLLNPNGILFGNGAQINVNGFMASTLALSDSQFMSGDIHLAQDPSHPLSYVINNGTINATNYAALVAPLVENTGSITATAGTIHLLGSSEAILTFNNNHLIGYSIGTVTGGTIHISAGVLSDAVRAVVNTSTLVEAGGVVDDGTGTIQLLGAEGTVVNTGNLSVNGLTSTSAGSLVINSSQATATLYGSTFTADGVGMNSNGGNLQILSNRNTYFNGSASAIGGSSGDGGFIEISGHNNLYWIGSVDATAANGIGGSLLIDPSYLYIINGAGGDQDAAAADGIILAGDVDTGLNSVSENRLETLAAGMNITLQAFNWIEIQDMGDNSLKIPTGAGFTFTLSTVNGYSGGIYVWDYNDLISTNGGSIVVSSTDYIDMCSMDSGGGNITMTSYQDLNASSLTGKFINLYADSESNGYGNIYQHPYNGNERWTATDMALRATGYMYDNWGGTIETTVTNLQILGGMTPYTTYWGWNSYILINNTGNLNLTNVLGLGGNGSAAVRNDSPYSITEISTSGNLTFSGNVTQIAYDYNRYYFYSGGSMIDDGNQATAIFIPQNYLDSYWGLHLYANGSIGASGVGPAFFNPFLDLQTGGYSMPVNVYALGNIFISYVNTAGVVNMSNFYGGNPGFGGQNVHIANLNGNINVNAVNADQAWGTGSWGTGNDNINFYTSADFTMTGGTMSTAVPNTSIYAAGNISLSGGTMAAATRINLTADSAFFAQNSLGTVNQTGGVFSCNAGGGMIISAASGVSITAGSISTVNLQVTNGTSGTISITDTGAGALTLANLGAGYAVRNNNAGVISITHGGNLTVAANVSSSTTAQVTLTSTNGILNQTGGTVTATNLLLRGATGITMNNFVATQLQLNNTGTGNITITTGAGVILQNLGAGFAASNTNGNITVTATGAITIAANITDTGTTTLTSTTLGVTQTAGTITATNLTVNAATGITLPTLAPTSLTATNSTSGNIQAINTGAMTVLAATNTGGGSITLTSSTGNLTIGNVTANGGGAINLTSTAGSVLDDGDNGTTRITTTGILTINATAGAIGAAAGANFNPYLDVTSGFNVASAFNAQSGLFVAFTGIATLNTSTLPTLNVTNVGGTIAIANITALGNIVVDSNIFNGTNDSVQLGALGNITVTNPVITSAAAILMQAAGAVTINNTVQSATTITIGADSSFFAQDGVGAITGAGLVSAPTLVLTSGSGTNLSNVATGNLSVVNSTSGAIAITNTGALTLTTATNVGVNTINISTTGTMTVQTVTTGSGAITLTSTTGSILDDGSQLTAITTTGAINLSAVSGTIGAPAAGNYNPYLDLASGFTGGTWTAQSALFVSITGAATFNTSSVGAINVTNVGGTIGIANMTPAGNLVINSNVFSGLNDSLELAALGDITLNGGQTVSTTGASITLNASGNITVSGVLTNLAGTINLTADSAVTGSNNAGTVTGAGAITTANLAVSAATGISLTNTNLGNLTATNTVSGALAITNTGALVVQFASNTGAVTLSSTGNLTVAGNVTSGGVLTLTSTTGSLGSTGGTISAPSLALNSATGMSLTGISIPVITATNTVSGDISLSCVSALTLNAITNNVGNVSISTTSTMTVAGLISSGGSTSLSSGGAFTQNAVGSDITAGGSVNIQAGGTALIARINSGGTLTIRSTGGSILDNNDAGSPVLNLVAGGDLHLTAKGTVGSNLDPIEIQVAGKAFIGAGGVDTGVSINMTGTTSNMDLIIVSAPPNGLIEWNGIFRLASLENTFGSVDFFYDVLRRRHDPRLHNTLQSKDTTREEGVDRKVPTLTNGSK